MRRWPFSTLSALPALFLFAGCGGDGGGVTDGPTQVGGPDSGIDINFSDLGGQGDSGGTDSSLDAANGGNLLGEACAVDDECRDGICLTEADFADGYCSALDCARHQDCGDDGLCLDGESTTFCADRCLADGECRDGYTCRSTPGSALRACLPDVPLVGEVDGGACGNDGDCRGGSCIDDDGWVDGYCTTVSCRNFEDCASDGEDNRCLIQRNGSSNFCVRICEGIQDCRNGYVCQGIGGGLGYCAPNPFQPLDLVPEDFPFDLVCEDVTGSEHTIDYAIAPETVAYMLTPIANDGQWLFPDDIDLPDGGRIDFGRDNDFQLTGSQLFGYTNPIIVPATPEFAAQLQAGEHTLTMETGAEEICHYLLEEETFGTTIDLNIYLVDVPGIDANTAADDEDMQVILSTFDAIYEVADVQLGEIRYFDITGDDADRYGVVRSEADVDALVSLTEPPGTSLDEVLSANVFFVRAMAFSDGGGAIGISSGLPGPAALHGTGASGVVFTSEFLGIEFTERSGQEVDGNEYTGVVFAHEVGHYLGLFHTSEQFGFSFDPLPDTPRCDSQNLNNCEDLNNLMFPFAGIDHTIVTEDQAWVIGVNPLTKD